MRPQESTWLVAMQIALFILASIRAVESFGGVRLDIYRNDFSTCRSCNPTGPLIIPAPSNVKAGSITTVSTGIDKNGCMTMVMACQSNSGNLTSYNAFNLNAGYKLTCNEFAVLDPVKLSQCTQNFVCGETGKWSAIGPAGTVIEGVDTVFCVKEFWASCLSPFC